MGRNLVGINLPSRSGLTRASGSARDWCCCCCCVPYWREGMWSGGGAGIDLREMVVGLACKWRSTGRSRQVSGQRGNEHTSTYSLSGSEPSKSRADFCMRNPPDSGVGTAGITTVRIVWGEVGGSTTDIWSEELSGTVLELSLELDVVLPETGDLFLKPTNTVQRAHSVVGEAHCCLEPSDRLFERGAPGRGGRLC